MTTFVSWPSASPYTDLSIAWETCSTGTSTRGNTALGYAALVPLAIDHQPELELQCGSASWQRCAARCARHRELLAAERHPQNRRLPTWRRGAQYAREK